MAELNLGKGLTAGKVASNVQKKLTRAQEKVRGAARAAKRGRFACEPNARPAELASSSSSAAAASEGAVSHHDPQSNLPGFCGCRATSA